MPVTPLQAAFDVLDRAESLLTLDPGTETATLIEYDLRRQALAMGVAALDTWMHWVIRRVELTALSSRLGRLEVPFSTLVEMGQKSVRPDAKCRSRLRCADLCGALPRAETPNG
jgi:hypothetical protein